MTNKTTSAIDLVEYLQSWVDGLDGSEERGMLQQAIARLNAQSDTITRLKAALEPFAEHPDFHASDDWAVTFADASERIPGVTAGDFRRAREAYRSSVGGE